MYNSTQTRPEHVTMAEHVPDPAFFLPPYAAWNPEQEAGLAEIFQTGAAHTSDVKNSIITPPLNRLRTTALKLEDDGTGTPFPAQPIADRARSKWIWRGQGLPTPDFDLLTPTTTQDAIARLGFPLVIKPISGTRPFQARKVETIRQLSATLAQAARDNIVLMAERHVAGETYRLTVKHGKAKFIGNANHLAADLRQRLTTLAQRAVHSLASHTGGMATLIVDHLGDAWVIEAENMQTAGTSGPDGSDAHALAPGSDTVTKTADLGKVGVLLGGPSSERAISLESGKNVLQALHELGTPAVAIDPDPSHLPEQLKKEDVDRVFNILHGRFGEDGTVQGLLEALAIPYTGSGVLASALAMDKARSKWLWRGAALPTPDFRVIDDTPLQEMMAQLGFPLMIKPVREGSSLGISKAHNAKELYDAVTEARKLDSMVMAERYISGREFTVGILKNQPLPIIGLKPKSDFYDYRAKYQSGDTEYLIPSGLTSRQESDLQTLALEAFQALGCHGWGRVDIMVDQAGHPWLLEVNTIPGMTRHSLVPKAAQAAGIEFNELIKQILETCGEH